ncbi:hypothetical protein DL766_007004 [Monosporascus sp. MC13-8B]|uniref:Uncharacterized protein n=1 Tax=Monosporascus cannonballus TaxID=155416 RepID=A0ABY0H591_9PEZI|nr:hypothetical protein DL762_005298 [Monosporascus cannonballus]RYO85274.1 hypothetical protein DL763_007156 [Monosporascus cannonballus]RYP25549.1 hypothetical protein DL766_007004 [Monosporascus sp. MC13-8B]
MLESISAPPFVGILGLCLILTSIALQFSSTILLSDFDTVPALTINQTNQLNVSYGPSISQQLTNQMSYSGALWTATPSEFTVFAEYNDPGYRRFSDAVHDTGVTVRSFLPISSKLTRMGLDRYHGYSTMLDTRVACIRPVLGNIIFFDIPSPSGYVHSPYLQGHATPSTHIPLLPSTASNLPANFSCPANQFDVTNSLGFGEPSFTLCPLNFYEGLKSPLTFNTLGGTVYLLFDHTNTTAARINTQDVWSTNDDGVWAKLIPPPSQTAPLGSDMRVTMCYDSRRFSNSTRLVSAESLGDREEPQISIKTTLIDNYPVTQLDTESVRRQLGATNDSLTLEERGLLKLELDPGYKDQMLPNPGHNIKSFDVDMTFLTIQPIHPIDALMLCTNCITDIYVPGNIRTVNHRLMAIFMDSLEETNSPALALQAVFTVLTQMAYYHLAPYFDILENGTITITESYYIPARSIGFASVTALLLIHLILVAIAVACFASWSCHTLLSNVWQAFTQAAVVVDENGLYNATTIPDKDIYRSLKEEGRDRETWHLTAVTQYYREPMGDMLEENFVSIRKKTV